MATYAFARVGTLTAEITSGQFVLGDTNGELVPTSKTSIPLSGFGAAAADVSFGGFKATLVATPTVGTDAVNKDYVDGVVLGTRDWKDSVRFATAAAPNAYTRVTNVITFDAVGSQSVDGIATVLNDRLLLKNGAAGADNGLYYVSTKGTGGIAEVWTRVTDADTSAEVTNGLTVATGPEGSANPNRIYILETADPITLNTTSLTFTLIGTFPTVQAGNGLANSNGVLSVNVDNVGIEISADTLQLKDDGVTYAKMQEVVANSFVANPTGSTANPQALTVGTDQMIVQREGGALTAQYPKARFDTSVPTADSGTVRQWFLRDMAGASRDRLYIGVRVT